MRFPRLCFLVLLTLAAIPLWAEPAAPEPATLVVGFLDESDTYNLVRHELDLIHLDSGQVLAHLKAKTHIVLQLPAGPLQLGLGHIRYGVRAYTPQEIELTTWEGELSAGQRQFVKIEVLHVLFKPSRFQLSSWSEPGQAELAKVGAQHLYQPRPADSLVPPAATRQSGWFIGGQAVSSLVQLGFRWCRGRMGCPAVQAPVAQLPSGNRPTLAFWLVSKYLTGARVPNFCPAICVR